MIGGTMHAYTNTKSNRNMSMSDYKTLLCIPIINIHPNRLLPLKNSGNRRRWTYLHKVGFFFQVGQMGYPTWIFELLNQKYNLNNTRNTLPIFHWHISHPSCIFNSSLAYREQNECKGFLYQVRWRQVSAMLLISPWLTSNLYTTIKTI